MKDRIKARLAAMTLEQKEQAMLRLLRFMCSDDEGNWDQTAADNLERACSEATTRAAK